MEDDFCVSREKVILCASGSRFGLDRIGTAAANLKNSMNLCRSKRETFRMCFRFKTNMTSRYDVRLIIFPTWVVPKSVSRLWYGRPKIRPLSAKNPTLVVSNGPSLVLHAISRGFCRLAILCIPYLLLHADVVSLAHVEAK